MLFSLLQVLSLLIQGTTVTQVAKWLDQIDEPERKNEIAIELPDEIKSAVSEIDITPEVLVHGNKLDGAKPSRPHTRRNDKTERALLYSQRTYRTKRK